MMILHYHVLSKGRVLVEDTLLLLLAEELHLCLLIKQLIQGIQACS